MDNKSKWLFGPRKTTNKPTTEMCSYELMLNNCYVDNQNAMYRDFDESRDIRSLIRDIAKSMRVYLTDDPELLDTALFEYLEDELDTTCGVLGLLYSLLWSKAELYEKLKQYEDAEERGEIGRVPRWIPVTERLPETEQPVLVVYVLGNTPCVTKAIYEDGSILSDDSFLTWSEIWGYGNYDEESDSYFIPCGWWEYGDFAEFNNAIDYPITHWIPLPEPPEVSHE